MTPQMSIAITGKNMAKPAFDSVVADANRTAGAIDATGGRMAASMGGASMQTANLAAQFNDIGVMLASGQSPLTLAIQQGTQISQVLGPMGAGQAVGALKTALLSLVNPVSLITIGTIAAGAAAFQWLMNAQGSAESATEAFERHRKEIDGIVAGYDAAETAVGAYFDAVSSLPRSIATTQLNGAFQAIGAEVDAFRAQMADFASDPLFAKFGSEANRSMQELAGAFADGEITAEDFYRQLEDVKDQLNLLEQAGAAIPGSTRNMIDAWQEGALKAIQFGNGIANLVAQSHALAGIAADAELATFFEENSVEGALDALKAMTPELRTQQQIIEDTYGKAMSNPALTDEGRGQLASAKQDALAAIATAEARREAAKAANEQSDAYGDLIVNLEHELALIGMSEREQAVLNNVRSAGVEATSQQGLAIRALTEQIYDQNKALSDAEAAAKAASKGLDNFAGGAKSELLGVVTALAKGWDAAGEAANRALQNMTSKALELAGSGLLDMLFGGLFGGSNVTSSITGSGGGFFPGLTGPSLPSFDGGGRTGSAPRSGGLDGKGGFLAMMHPDETVIDHTLSAGSAQGGVSVVRVELGQELEGRILQQAAGQSVQIVASAAPTIAEQGSNQAGSKLRSGEFDGAMRRFGSTPQAKRR